MHKDNYWEEIVREFRNQPTQYWHSQPSPVNIHINNLNIFECCEYGRNQQVRQVLIFSFNNNKYIIMGTLNLQNGFQAPIVEGLVDASTLQPIPGATKVNKSRTSDTPAVANVDSDGNLVAVSVGTGNLTVVNTWTYVDQNTQSPVTADQTTVQPFAVTPTLEGVLQVVTLGPAVPIPTPTPPTA